MKYFTLQTVKQAYEANKLSTKNKFWGLLSILSSIDCATVDPCVSYDFDTTKVSEFLENLFCLEDNKKTYSESSIWNIMLSAEWTTKVPEQMLVNTPNIYNVIVWYFRNRGFEDNIDEAALLKLFLEDTHISVEDAKKLFDFTHKDLQYDSILYSEQDLRDSLGIAGTNITAEGDSIVAHAGELSRAPFIQTLYAGQSTLECLIITPFRFSNLYGSQGAKGKGIKDLQKIYFGAPGSGKSYQVKNIVSSHEDFTFRTTFHPDSDYASFVGSYKPIMSQSCFIKQSGTLTIKQLADILKDRYNNANQGDKITSIFLFGIEYSEYFNGIIKSYSKKDVIDMAIPNTRYETELNKAVNL